MSAYYNENDPFAASWLRALIARNLIAAGEVDERSIADVQPDDLKGFKQCHFFAGIGGWSHALRLAGWPDDRPVWTGSCPCQPFSAAGKRKGAADERHLWPAFFHFIDECRPGTIFGEQVASKDGLAWLDLVSFDLEAANYSIGAADLCAAGFGAPHIRQRLYFVADSQFSKRGSKQKEHSDSYGRNGFGRSRDITELEHTESDGRIKRRPKSSGRGIASRCGEDTLDNASDARHGNSWKHVGGSPLLSARSEQSSNIGVTQGDANNKGSQGWELFGATEGRKGASECPARSPSFVNGFWSSADWLPCIDGKARPVEPGPQQMVDGSTKSLGFVCDVNSIEKEIEAWSKRHQTDARKALRNLWNYFQSEAIQQWSSGRCYSIREKAFLLAFLRQLADQRWRFSFGDECASTQASQTILRIVRVENETGNTSYRRGLDEQWAGESSDSLQELSQIVAHYTEESWGDPGWQETVQSFPLTRGAINRVGRLRGYGNAIVPQVAAGFIRAYLEVVLC